MVVAALQIFLALMVAIAVVFGLFGLFLAVAVFLARLDHM